MRDQKSLENLTIEELLLMKKTLLKLKQMYESNTPGTCSLCTVYNPCQTDRSSKFGHLTCHDCPWYVFTGESCTRFIFTKDSCYTGISVSMIKWNMRKYHVEKEIRLQQISQWIHKINKQLKKEN